MPTRPGNDDDCCNLGPCGDEPYAREYCNPSDCRAGDGCVPALVKDDGPVEIAADLEDVSLFPDRDLTVEIVELATVRFLRVELGKSQLIREEIGAKQPTFRLTGRENGSKRSMDNGTHALVATGQGNLEGAREPRSLRGRLCPKSVPGITSRKLDNSTCGCPRDMGQGS